MISLQKLAECLLVLYWSVCCDISLLIGKWLDLCIKFCDLYLAVNTFPVEGVRRPPTR